MTSLMEGEVQEEDEGEEEGEVVLIVVVVVVLIVVVVVVLFVVVVAQVDMGIEGVDMRNVAARERSSLTTNIVCVKILG